MKCKLLNRADVERQLSEMWGAINSVPEEQRAIARQQVSDLQDKWLLQLDIQDKALPLLWETANIINPENPLHAALQIAANAERLKIVLKSYSLQN